MQKYTRVFTTIALLILISNFPISPSDSKSYSNSLHLISRSITSTTNHPSIQIYDENDFSLLGFTGNGSITNPYVIEGLSIVANSTCISISNIDAHFIIRDCILTSTDSFWDDGIYMYNCLHGVVDNCTFNFFRYGIRCKQSESCVVVNNNFQNNSVSVFLERSTSFNFTNNAMTNNGILFYTEIGYTQKIYFEHSFENNTVNGYPLVFLNNTSDTTLSNYDFGQLILLDCNNVSVKSSRIASRCMIAYSPNCQLTDCTSVLESYYITTLASDNSTFYRCRAGIMDIRSRYTVINDSELSGRLYLHHMDCNVSYSNINNVIGEFDNNIFVHNNIESAWFSTTDSYFRENTIGSLTFQYSSNCELLENELLNGVNLELGSSNFTFLNNRLEDAVRIIASSSEDMFTFTNNTIRERPLVYINNISDTIVDVSGHGQTILLNCTNVKIVNGSYSDMQVGPQILYSRNCSIVSCAVYNITGNGFVIDRSQNCYVINVTSEYSENGVVFRNSDDCVLRSSRILGSLASGIIGYNSDYLYLEENIITESEPADDWYLYACIDLAYCDYSIVTQNKIANNYYCGLLFEDCNNSTLFGNNVLWNTYGVYSIESNNLVLSENIIRYNEYGIRMTDSNHWLVVDNIISDNKQRGVAIYSGSSNCFYGNELAWNGIGFIGTHYFANAEDDGTNNTWDDGVSIGNRWHDYNGTGIYPVYGLSGSVDRYPQLVVDNDPPQIIGPSDIVLYDNESSVELVWYVSDAHIRLYEVQMSDEMLVSDFVKNSTIQFNLQNLNFGEYEISIRVTDGAGNEALDYVRITVTSVLPTNATSTTFTITNESSTATITESTLNTNSGIIIIIISSTGILAIVVVFIIIKNKKT